VAYSANADDPKGTREIAFVLGENSMREICSPACKNVLPSFELISFIYIKGCFRACSIKLWFPLFLITK
jgi:hypothetical protein